MTLLTCRVIKIQVRTIPQIVSRWLSWWMWLLFLWIRTLRSSFCSSRSSFFTSCFTFLSLRSSFNCLYTKFGWHRCDRWIRWGFMDLNIRYFICEWLRLRLMSRGNDIGVILGGYSVTFIYRDIRVGFFPGLALMTPTSYSSTKSRMPFSWPKEPPPRS